MPGPVSDTAIVVAPPCSTQSIVTTLPRGA
jgi:phosphosulfolactate phosphohydrolase-like enzyme